MPRREFRAFKLEGNSLQIVDPAISCSRHRCLFAPTCANDRKRSNCSGLNKFVIKLSGRHDMSTSQICNICSISNSECMGTAELTRYGRIFLECKRCNQASGGLIAEFGKFRVCEERP